MNLLRVLIGSLCLLPLLCLVRVSNLVLLDLLENRFQKSLKSVTVQPKVIVPYGGTRKVKGLLPSK